MHNSPLNEQKRIVNQINSLMPLIIEYGDYKEKLDKLNSEFPDKLKSSILQIKNEVKNWLIFLKNKKIKIIEFCI